MIFHHLLDSFLLTEFDESTQPFRLFEFPDNFGHRHHLPTAFVIPDITVNLSIRKDRADALSFFMSYVLLNFNAERSSTSTAAGIDASSKSKRSLWWPAAKSLPTMQ